MSKVYVMDGDKFISNIIDIYMSKYDIFLDCFSESP